MDYFDFSGEFSVESDEAIVSNKNIDSDNDSEKGQDFLLTVHSSSFSTNLAATEKAFIEMVESSEVLNVVLDLTNVVHFHSRALRLLVDLQVGLQRRGRTLTLRGVTILTQRLFEYTRLDQFFCYERSGSQTAISN